MRTVSSAADRAFAFTGLLTGFDISKAFVIALDKVDDHFT